jgi:prolipoprotein diacylglyceryltransferase
MIVLTGEMSISFEPSTLKAAAIAAAAPLTQAIGRGRCLVQGCCHGGRSIGRYTMKIVNPMSRVSYVAHLTGEPVVATQLFSAVANILAAAVLLRLWFSGARATLVCGLYLIIVGLARFAEEGLRAEPQTPSWGGLSIYQWLCAVMIVCGIAFTLVPSTPLVPAMEVNATSIGLALIVGLFATILMSIDMPDSGLPLSLLAPNVQRKGAAD